MCTQPRNVSSNQENSLKRSASKPPQLNGVPLEEKRAAAPGQGGRVGGAGAPDPRGRQERGGSGGRTRPEPSTWVATPTCPLPCSAPSIYTQGRPSEPNRARTVQTQHGQSGPSTAHRTQPPVRTEPSTAHRTQPPVRTEPSTAHRTRHRPSEPNLAPPNGPSAARPNRTQKHPPDPAPPVRTEPRTAHRTRRRPFRSSSARPSRT
ncbi:hypothetical protein P7K49_008996 [Saguinus oedipus]|uniref:Uncharacterized protein n=1 Tax=Saguinus oedipus TaxID=9490 RepID=A0ABQ9VZW7_SAGOE|nr:hypothetical protein P7K49_008996 [Saguinus oedipus]